MRCEWVQTAIADGTLIVLFIVVGMVWVRPRKTERDRLRRNANTRRFFHLPRLRAARLNWRVQLKRDRKATHTDD